MRVDYPRALRAPSVFQNSCQRVQFYPLRVNNDPRARGCSQRRRAHDIFKSNARVASENQNNFLISAQIRQKVQLPAHFENIRYGSFLRRRFHFDLLKTCVIANEGVQEANNKTASSEDRYPQPRPEDNCFVLLRR